jgi:endonuclease/exonuclease/phosphatase family metal-dependent hydrolase
VSSPRRSAAGRGSTLDNGDVVAHARVMRLALLAFLLVVGCARLPDPRDPRIEVVSPTAAHTAATTRELRVVEFNTHGQPGELVADALQRDPMLRDADVYVLTEIHRASHGCSAACVIASALGDAAVYAPGHAERDHGDAAGRDGDGGIAIVTRGRIESPRVIELPEYNIHVARERRIGLAATVTLDGATAPIAFYAVHLENRLTPRERARQLQPILDDARALATPVVIAGDVNTSPFSWLAHVLPIPTGTQTTKLERFVRSNGFDTPVIGSGATSRFLQMRLDAIYTRGIMVHSYAVSNAFDVSDHLAMVTSMSN